ncbi:MAG: amidohydrolase family protein [Phycisphaerales bacterium JB063]
MKQGPPTVIQAGAVRDAAGVDARPGVVWVERGQVVASGPPRVVPPPVLEQARRIELPGALVLPAMVNAHAHLDLTSVGPRPYDPAGGFVGWVQMLRSHLPGEAGSGGRVQADWLAASARAGAAMSLAAGVQAVGDISGVAQTAQVRRAAGLAGVTYVEAFGLGAPNDAEGLAEAALGGEGLQPHAPYSAGPALYAAAAASGRPVATHLAETLDELAFVASLSGAKMDFVRSIGRWQERFASGYGRGASPVQWMRPHLERAAPAGGWLLAHCNYVEDDDIALLADTNASVAYCPVASAYFGHPHGGQPAHRYRDMLAAGVNVCLGTDSIVCADPDDPQPLGLLGAMRALYRRDGTDPATLLAMATVHGARALRMPATTATLRPGAPARFALIDIDPNQDDDVLRQAMRGDARIEPLDLT